MMRKEGIRERTNTQEKTVTKSKNRGLKTNENSEITKTRRRNGNIRNRLNDAEVFNTSEQGTCGSKEEDTDESSFKKQLEDEKLIEEDSQHRESKNLCITEGSDVTLNEDGNYASSKTEKCDKENLTEMKQEENNDTLTVIDKVKEEMYDFEEYVEKTPEVKEKRKIKSKYNNMENDGLEKMLKWKNRIGHLPGSNLKFRKSDVGALEVIAPDSEDEEDNEQSEKKGRKRKALFKGPKGPGSKSPTMERKIEEDHRTASSEAEKRKRKERKKKKKFADDELLKCETCGCYGIISEFRSSGRFCSQRCVGAYASKRRAEMIAEQFANGERPLPKSGRRPTKKRKNEVKDSPPMKNGSPYHSNASSPLVTDNVKKSFFADDSTMYYASVGYEQEFDWDMYLNITKTKAVPAESLTEDYHKDKIFADQGVKFKPTNKLECIDPKHQSCICVVSVVEVQGSRMRLHFDGWSESYDFWINSTSFFLRPCSWCEKNGQTLNPPRGMDPKTFNWSQYLQDTGCDAAPSYLFKSYEPSTHGFKTNMKLEAIDRKNPDLICVSSVNNIIGDHFLVHFDEWDDSFDYWCKNDSPYIHPVGWCHENQVPLVPPTDEMANIFSWDTYLKETNAIAAPKNIFKWKKDSHLEVGAKLEVVDPRNPSLVRVSTICEVEAFRVKIHFDGWDSIYDYWFDTDSVDLHPINWCKKTGHLLEAPPSDNDSAASRLCGSHGCRGIGHIKGAKYTTHHTSFGCPYTLHNINRSTSPVVDRLAVNAMNEENSIINRVHNNKKRQVEDILPDSTTKGDPAKARAHVGRPSKKNFNTPENHDRNNRIRNGIRKRRRRRSDEVSSSTNDASNVNTEHSNSYLTKPIPPTRRPAGNANLMYQQGKTFVNKAIPWSQDDVVEFLKNIGFDDLTNIFKEHQIDGQALLLLSQADLIHHLKLKLGPALKIYSEISKL